MITNLGKLEEIEDLRSVWPNEARNFTPWLKDNINCLGERLGIEFESVEMESPTGDFSVDIFAMDAATGRKIIIENQLETTDHDHLGKLITYAAGKDADVVIWLVKKARDEHRFAVEWLNNHTTEDIGFILCEIKLFRIGNSPVAPDFVVIEKPNDWFKRVKPRGPFVRMSLPRINDMLEWGIVKAGDIISCKYTDEEVELLENGNVQTSEGELSLQQWLRNATGWPSVQTYVFAIHKETGKTLQQLRKDYMDQHPEVS